MKLTLTQKEAQDIIRDRLNLTSTVEIFISRPPRKRFGKRERVIQEIEKLDYTNGQKILAIKSLREMIPGLGLADSKWAIENWSEFKKIKNPFVFCENDWTALRSGVAKVYSAP